jgi:molecular chaperone HscB
MRHVVLGVARAGTTRNGPGGGPVRILGRGVKGRAVDYFEVFGLPRRLGIDTAELQRKFYELSRRGHPDFHQGETPERQAEILEASARLNAAYRALRDPLARIEYLVRLEEGRDTREGATVKPKAPPELLEEMFEIQEALQEAKSAGQSGGVDAGAKETLVALRDRLRERDEQEESRLRGPLSQAWDAAAPAERAGALKAFKESLAVRAYLRTVIDDIDEALGTSQEGHVSHRRH